MVHALVLISPLYLVLMKSVNRMGCHSYDFVMSYSRSTGMFANVVNISNQLALS